QRPGERGRGRPGDGPRPGHRRRPADGRRAQPAEPTEPPEPAEPAAAPAAAPVVPRRGRRAAGPVRQGRAGRRRAHPGRPRVAGGHGAVDPGPRRPRTGGPAAPHPAAASPRVTRKTPMTSLTPTTHPCPGCGASVQYAPGTTTLRCPYCGSAQPIQAPARQVREHSFDAFLAKPRVRSIAPNQFTYPGCGARTEHDAISKDCQFCGTALVAGSTGDEIAPEAVIPFALDRKAAREALAGWTRSRWFAPNRLKKVSEAESLKSTYLPHWTFDADTRSHYTGRRGEHYWVTETYTQNGQTKTRRVRKTRWYPASGSVSRVFDDVLVPATARVPRT